LHYHPYKIQVAQELSEQDKEDRLQFCSQFFDLMNSNRNILNSLLMSDEAHFHMSGYVNKQNCRFWAANNPRELHQCPLHSTVYFGGIIGPYFFEDEEGRILTVNAERYTAMLKHFCETS
jgi:hypothetical protein